MGVPGKGDTLERIDNDKGYEPGNCVWANQAAQMRNTRRNMYIEYEGERMTAAEWARHLGLPRATISQRMKRKLPISEVLSTEMTPARRGWVSSPRVGRRRKPSGPTA